MKKMNTYFIVLIIILLYNGCIKKECHREFTFINNSEDSVIVAFLYNDGFGQCNLGYSFGVSKQSTSMSDKYRNCFEDTYSAYDLEFYLIDPNFYNDPFDFYDCDSIFEKNKVLKHYVLSLDTLKQLDFRVTYP